jgi:hypothetical protein
VVVVVVEVSVPLLPGEQRWAVEEGARRGRFLAQGGQSIPPPWQQQQQQQQRDRVEGVAAQQRLWCARWAH